MTRGDGKGSAQDSIAVTVDNVPADPAADRTRQAAEADAAVASAEAKVAKQKKHLAKAAGKDKKERQRDHLAGAEEALAQAIAARKELD